MRKRSWHIIRYSLLKTLGLCTVAIALYLPNSFALDSSNIIAGKDAQANEAPWVASLFWTFLQADGRSPVCTASLIAPDYILTAAHCVTYDYDTLTVNWLPLEGAEVSIRIGSNRLSPNEGQSVKVREVIVHPDWNQETLDADLALLRLAEPLDIPAISLGAGHISSSEARAYGYGYSSVQEPTIPLVLQSAELPLQSAENCQRGNGALYSSQTMICAGSNASSTLLKPGSNPRAPLGPPSLNNGDEQSGTCFGDSGGPLVVTENGQDRLIGVTSWGPSASCQNQSGYDVFVNVEHFRSWIEQTLDSEKRLERMMDSWSDYFEKAAVPLRTIVNMYSDYDYLRDPAEEYYEAERLDYEKVSSLFVFYKNYFVAIDDMLNQDSALFLELPKKKKRALRQMSTRTKKVLRKDNPSKREAQKARRAIKRFSRKVRS